MKNESETMVSDNLNENTSEKKNESKRPASRPRKQSKPKEDRVPREITQEEALVYSSSDDEEGSKPSSEESEGSSNQADRSRGSRGSKDGRRSNPNNRSKSGGHGQRGKQQKGPSKNRKSGHNNHHNKNNRDSRHGGRNAPIKRGLEYAPKVSSLMGLEEAKDPVVLAERISAISDEGSEHLDFNALYALSLNDLEAAAQERGVDIGYNRSRLVVLSSILENAAEKKQAIFVEGVLDLLESGAGVLVYENDSYHYKPLNVFVPKMLIQQFGLKKGHLVGMQAEAPREGEDLMLGLAVRNVMDVSPEDAAKVTPFNDLIPYYPLERIFLEAEGQSDMDRLSMRVVDLLTPIGLGQRGLIVAPPRTGKTILLQGIAKAIIQNNPNAYLIVLLVDERPEEVTDFQRQVKAEVVSSTFDQSAESHVHAAEMVIEKSRRMVEAGQDVIILLDSITRLARAYNTLMPSSGKILSGGVEANALQLPKRFFGSARNIEDGGSLTIIGSALVDTGSRMDEVIFEEFKGAGNMELHLDRALVDKRIFPAINLEKSGTRKEELLYHPDEMNKIYSLRRVMKGVPSVEAMEMLIQRVKKTKNNPEFLMSVNQ